MKRAGTKWQELQEKDKNLIARRFYFPPGGKIESPARHQPLPIQADPYSPFSVHYLGCMYVLLVGDEKVRIQIINS